MAISVGSRLSQYELTALIGEGGMGRVFEARDSRLGRTVAVKVLPDALATDAERIARFEREAKMLASLNHPNIASLIGLDQSDGTHFLVMEMVAGETIADRLRRGPVPVPEAIAIGMQIAEALEAAHARGVVHRDLKPANVKVTPDGVVKVLDFGLAKAMDVTPGGPEASPAAANSPTLSMMATQAGLILGTAAYMSPEQAKGAAADARSDVFSFGCMFFEMLTGRQAFLGDTAAEVLAQVLIREADLTQLPPHLDSRLSDVLRRCLEKNPKRRWQAAGDLRLELEAIATGPAVAIRALPVIAPRPLWRRAAPHLIAVLLTGGVAAAVGWRLKPATLPSVAQFAIYPAEGTSFMSAGRPTTAGVISPDGRTLAFTAKTDGGSEQVWVRPIDALVSQPLSATEGASFPFWSPDSRFIAFFANDKLLKISAAGGPPLVLCEAPVGRGGAWSRDGTILFNAVGANVNGLSRVSSAGGAASAVTKTASGQGSHRFPAFLPDGRHFLFAVNNAVNLGSLDSDPTTRLIDATSSGAVFSTGHLIFVRQGTLMAQPFDSEKLELHGEPFPVAQNVSASSAFQGLLTFSVSDTGTLVYGAGQQILGGQLVWVDRRGQSSQAVGAPGQFKGIDLSPDQKQVVFHRDQGDGGDVWVMDLERGAVARLTSDGPQQHAGPAIWSPDGGQIVYGTLRSGKWGLRQRAASGLGAESTLLESDDRLTPMDWSADGRFIVYQQRNTKTGEDIWILPLTGDRKPIAFDTSAVGQRLPAISPDGKWVAYVSGETSEREVYIRAFPTGPEKRVVSAGGGAFPRWRADGRELYYVKGDDLSISGVGVLMAVEFRPAGSTFDLGIPRPLFDNHYFDPGPDQGGNYHIYAASRDGQRFLVPRLPSSLKSDSMPDPIVVVLNWATTLKP